MGAAIYFLRVLLVSGEAVVIVLFVLILRNFYEDLVEIAKAITLQDELMKFLVLVPFALFAWIVKEARLVVAHGDRDGERLLVAWDHYWKLKAHLVVSLIYSVVFLSMSISAFVGVDLPMGALLFGTGVLGQLVVAGSLYFSRLRVREILSKA